jgi:hypothetical protein
MTAVKIQSVDQSVYCPTCLAHHTTSLEVWNAGGVIITRYDIPCEPKPIYGFAH